jgi:hypothetical protein
LHRLHAVPTRIPLAIRRAVRITYGEKAYYKSVALRLQQQTNEVQRGSYSNIRTFKKPFLSFNAVIGSIAICCFRESTAFECRLDVEWSDSSTWPIPRNEDDRCCPSKRCVTGNMLCFFLCMWIEPVWYKSFKIADKKLSKSRIDV